MSDINEVAFYGKKLKTINRYESSKDEDDPTQQSARTKEINSIQKLIKSSFLEKGEPPLTSTDFYRIGKMLGRGAFGKVNLAMHKLVRKLVALKSLNKALVDQ